MSKRLRIFVDSDVIITSILSNKGAAYRLINTSSVRKIVSNYSFDEIEKVCKRLNLSPTKIKNIIKKCEIIKINLDFKSIKKNYELFVADKNDAHIVKGAIESKSRFLVTYNLKHYKIELIKRKFNIIVLSPGTLLQYLRSRN